MYGGGTVGERSDWHGEPVYADDVRLGRTCDVCVGRVCLRREWFRMGRARTTSLEAVKRTGGNNGLQAGASPINTALRMTSGHSQVAITWTC